MYLTNTDTDVCSGRSAFDTCVKRNSLLIQNLIISVLRVVTTVIYFTTANKERRFLLVNSHTFSGPALWNQLPFSISVLTQRWYLLIPFF